MGDRLKDFESRSNQVLAAYLQENSTALELARKGMAVSCVVPVEYTQTWIASQTSMMMRARDLGHAFEIEAILHQREGDMDQALSSALDLVRMGFALGNRGVLINSMVSSACELQGVYVITNLLDHLNSSQCRSAIRVLEELDRQREPMDALFARERRWSVRTGGYLEYVKFMVEQRSLRPEKHVWNSLAELQSRLRQLRQFRIQIAARAFELDHGRAPAMSSELVPAYLKNLPADPETGTPMSIAPTP